MRTTKRDKRFNMRTFVEIPPRPPNAREAEKRALLRAEIESLTAGLPLSVLNSVKGVQRWKNQF